MFVAYHGRRSSADVEPTVCRKKVGNNDEMSEMNGDLIPILHRYIITRVS